MSANVIIQFRRGTASAWSTANPTLANGEVGLETDTSKLKIGDGSTAWNSLGYLDTASYNNLGDLSDVTITSAADGDFLRWNGSAWINDAVNLGTDSVGDYVESLTAGTGVTLTNNTGEGATPTIAIGQSVGTTDDVTFNTVTTDAGITVGGHIVPDADVAYDLGSTTNKFRDLYLSGSSIELGGVSITSDGTTVSIPSLSTSGGLTGDLTGDVTGNADTATALETARTIQISGDVAGSASFDGTANINISATVQPDSVALGTDTTGNYTESVTGGTGVTVTGGTGEGNTPSIAIGQAVGTTDNVTFNDVIVDGNLTVNGTTTTVNTETINLADNVIVINSNATGSATENGGLEVERGDDANVTLIWDETNDRWTVGTETFVAGTFIGDVTGDVTGNADTATALETARTISLSGDVAGSVSFDGTSNVDITATIQADSVALGTDTTGDYTEGVTGGTGVTVTGGTGEGNTPSIAIGQAVGTTDDVTFNDVTVDGNLTVNGTTTTLNTETLSVEDNIVTLNSNVTGAPSTNAGIEIERGTSANVLLRWNETSDAWEWTNDGTTYYPFPTEFNQIANVSVGSPSDGDIILYDSSTSTWVQTTPDLTLTTGRSDVTITSATTGDFLKWNGSAWVNDQINLGTDTVGDYVQNLTAGTGVTLSNNSGEGASPTIAIGQDVASGANVTFGTVTANLSGNVTGDLTGNVTGTVSDISNHNLSGIGDVTITSATSGEFLKWNGAAWINASIPEINTLNDVGNVSITSATAGDILEWSGSAWVNTTLAFDDLSDVDMTTVAPSEGDIAYYDGAKWVAQPWNFTSGAGVTVTSATDGQILTYDDATGAWVNSDLVVTTTLEDLTDTTTTGASDGDLLVYRTSTGWTNEPPETAHPLAY